MLRKSRFPGAILLISLGIAWAATFIQACGWLDILELKTVDARFSLRYSLNKKLGRISVSDQAVLVAIDQKSVDPSYSEFSDRWGMGGWLTRDFWTHAVYNFASFYKPRVVGYD